MKTILFSVLMASLFTGCALDLATGRSQLSPVEESGLQLMSANQYNSYIAESKTKVLGPQVDINAAMVERVGARLTKAITKYYNHTGQKSLLKGYNWEFNTVDSKEINAWCMPGGKVVVYTGLLAVTQNEAALAIVLGHEIAHAIGNHTAERISLAMKHHKLEGSELEDVLALTPTERQNILLTSYVDGNHNLNKSYWSNHQETEADKFGLMFAALAGYDPNEAIPFWERMSSAEEANQPGYLSSYNSDNTRFSNLKIFMPGALKFYSQKIEKDELQVANMADLKNNIIVEESK